MALRIGRKPGRSMRFGWFYRKQNHGHIFILMFHGKIALKYGNSQRIWMGTWRKGQTQQHKLKTLWQFESWKGQILPAGFGFFSMCDATGGDWTSFPTSTIVSWTGMLDMKRGRDNFPAYQCNYLIVHPHWILWTSHESTEFIVLKILILVLSCYNYWSIPLKLVRGTGLPTQ